MTPADEYRLNEKRKRTGDMLQSLKLGPMLSSGTLMRFIFFLSVLCMIRWFLLLQCNIIMSVAFSVSITQDRRHISPARRTVTAKPPPMNAQAGESVELIHIIYGDSFKSLILTETSTRQPGEAHHKALY